MSWKGVPKKEDFMPLFASDWNKVVDALDELYFGIKTGTGNIYVDTLTANKGEFKESLKVQGKNVLKDLDPIYIAGLLDRAKQDIREALYITSKALETLKLNLGTTPTRLSPTPLKAKRIVLKASPTNIYTVWVGNYLKQEFPLFAGEKEEVTVEDAYQIFVKSDGTATLFVLVEKV